MNKDEERRRIGKRITELRKEKGMTQQKVADYCGLNQCHVARIEKGSYSVGLDTLSIIAESLGKKIDFV